MNKALLASSIKKQERTDDVLPIARALFLEKVIEQLSSEIDKLKGTHTLSSR